MSVVPKPYGTRAEHLAWCKQRALELLDKGDVAQAFASFVSDASKHEETATLLTFDTGLMTALGRDLAVAKNGAGLREWIEGWN